MKTPIKFKLNQIKKVFPQKIKLVKINEKGEDNFVLEINQDWIFRFPRNKTNLQPYYERKFLPLFEKISPIPVPHLEYITKDFVGYKKIKGVLLTKRCFNSLSKKEQDKISQKFGQFLSAIHSFPIKKAKKLGLTESWGGWRKKAVIKFRKEVAPLLSKEVRKKAMDFLKEFFKMKYRQVVIYGDFYPPDHVIYYNKKDKRISGIIDFGDLTIEDATTDFTSIYEDFGKNFFNKVLQNYSRKVDKNFVERIKIRIKAAPLFDASYMLEYGQKEKFKKKLKEIERLFG